MESHIEPHAVSVLLASAAEADESITDIATLEDGGWSLLIEHAGECLVELEEDGRSLVLSIEIGRPPAERSTEALSAALCFNTLWRETGGMTMSRAEIEGEVALTQQLPAAAVLGDDFAARLKQFTDIAVFWRTWLEMAETPQQSPDQFALMQMRA